jgi:predicted Rossmann-fold nucleotide-binding protein
LIEYVAELRSIMIVSGGQTGADRAALDFAVENRIRHGGWCPRGRLTEDGPLAARYMLNETPSRKYAQRTEWNVRDSDATVVFSIAAVPQGGTGLTLAMAARMGKPVLHLSRDGLSGESDYAIDAAAEELLAFLEDHSVETLNVAGPRASQEPEIADFVSAVLQHVLDAG